MRTLGTRNAIENPSTGNLRDLRMHLAFGTKTTAGRVLARRMWIGKMVIVIYSGNQEIKPIPAGISGMVDPFQSIIKHHPQVIIKKITHARLFYFIHKIPMENLAEIFQQLPSVFYNNIFSIRRQHNLHWVSNMIGKP
ncbi:MAG: hypothetical protein LBM92_03515, partial [Opitutaceae bacterium]|nr:hypothetical protein [Opitutaceae bacterium]